MRKAKTVAEAEQMHLAGTLAGHPANHPGEGKGDLCLLGVLCDTPSLHEVEISGFRRDQGPPIIHAPNVDVVFRQEHREGEVPGGHLRNQRWSEDRLEIIR